MTSLPSAAPITAAPITAALTDTTTADTTTADTITTNTITAAPSTLELAQAIAEQSRIVEKDWHRLKSNRKARAQEQLATAMVFLLKDNPAQAMAHLQQAIGWLDRSISAPPCPSHGSKH
jgi:patatin-like phospholipase/acyl hydrolase